MRRKKEREGDTCKDIEGGTRVNRSEVGNSPQSCHGNRLCSQTGLNGNSGTKKSSMSRESINDELGGKHA